MPQLSNYSVHLNAVPAVASGNFTAGQAVCRVSATGGYVVANTANRTWATGALWGIALENGIAGGNAVQIVNNGYVPPEVFPSPITGSGDFVNVNASGNLVRNTAVTADTIGRYMPDGGVEVDINLQVGGSFSGSATSIQGQSVINTGLRSQLLSFNGSALEWRDAAHVNILDYAVNKANLLAGTEDALVALNAAVAASTQNTVILFPRGTYKFSDTFSLLDDTVNGNKRAFTFRGTSGNPRTELGTMPQISANWTDPNGTAATITTHTNGGAGQIMQTITGLSGLVAADVGREIVLCGCADDDNNGSAIITSVISATSCTVERYVGSASDANSGSIVWRIYRPLWDIRASDVCIERLFFKVENNCTIGHLLELNHSEYGTGTRVLGQTVMLCYFSGGDSGATSGKCRDNVSIAKGIVPRNGSNHYTTNGSGIPQVWEPTQVDTILFWRCQFNRPQRFGIAHYSFTGQSKEVHFEHCEWNFAVAGYACPRTLSIDPATHSGRANGWANFVRCGFGAVFLAALTGNSNGTRVFEHCYSEGIGAICQDNAGNVPQSISFTNCDWTITPASMSPDGRIGLFAGGPVAFVGGRIQIGNNTKAHIVHYASRTHTENTSVMIGTFLNGASTHTRMTTRSVSSKRGPFKFAGTETLSMNVKVGGGGSVGYTTAAFSVANINSALSWASTQGLTWFPFLSITNLNMVPAWVVAIFIWRDIGKQVNGGVDFTANSTAVGISPGWNVDDALGALTLRPDESSGSQLQITGGTANNILGLSTGLVGSVAQVRICKDTAGWLDLENGVSQANVFWRANSNWTGSDQGTLLGVDRRYGGAAVGANTMTLAGGTFTCANNKDTTVTDTRVTATSHITLTPTNQAAATLMAGTTALFVQARTADTNFTVRTQDGVAAAGTETFTYSIVEPL